MKTELKTEMKENEEEDKIFSAYMTAKGIAWGMQESEDKYEKEQGDELDEAIDILYCGEEIK